MSDTSYTLLDRHFADFMTRLAGRHDEELSMAARLVSHKTGQGHICLDLEEYAGRTAEIDGRMMSFPPLDPWQKSLALSPVVGRPGEFFPLILDPPLLYLQRYWQYEKIVAEFIRERSGLRLDLLDRERLRDGLNRFFPKESNGVDWQKVAALSALSNRFCVISGGPGTGKTTTVAGILALYIEQGGANVLLAAPTGKAAARLRQAISGVKKNLACDGAVRDKIPEQAVTVHRLLGWGRQGFRYHGDNPLAADLVVIDEASMVDLPLMAALMSALPKGCRLLLLGDRNQLSSVQPGAVLGDICQDGAAGFSLDFVKLCTDFGCKLGLSPTPGPGHQDGIVELSKSYRFGPDSGIHRLSCAVNQGEADLALDILTDEKGGDISWRDYGSASVSLESVLSAHVHYFKELALVSEPEEALGMMGSFAILCGLRKGLLGSLNINQLVRRSLQGADQEDFFHGRPVMVSRNDYTKQLYNGDTGICLRDRENEGQLRVFFADGDSIRKMLPLRLPTHETVFAMTVHKSQGSEFDHLLLILPDRPSRVMSRELLYTAVTRARKSVEIIGTREAFRQAVNTRIERKSGLVKRLWQSKLP